MTARASYSPPMPAGATWADKWDDDNARGFSHPTIDVGDATVFIVGVQYRDGCTGRSINLRIPGFDGAADFTPLYARRLAAMLQNLADTCEILDEAAK